MPVRSRLDTTTVAMGLACAVLLAFTGVVANGVGLVACTEDYGSSDRSPHLCASLRTRPGFLVSLLIPPAVIGVLMFRPARRRLLGYAGVYLLVAQGVVFTMWALVAHGTISY